MLQTSKNEQSVSLQFQHVLLDATLLRPDIQRCSSPPEELTAPATLRRNHRRARVDTRRTYSVVRRAAVCVLCRA